MTTPRADVVGSLLRPAHLREARQGAREGRVNAGAVETRLREATRHVPLERLAVSPQCGFASGEAGNPLTPEQQEAKLRLVATLARRIWPG